MHSLLLDDTELLHGIEDLIRKGLYGANYALRLQRDRLEAVFAGMDDAYFRNRIDDIHHAIGRLDRSDENTSEIQSLMRISYATFCLNKNNKRQNNKNRS